MRCQTKSPGSVRCQTNHPPVRCRTKSRDFLDARPYYQILYSRCQTKSPDSEDAEANHRIQKMAHQTARLRYCRNISPGAGDANQITKLSKMPNQVTGFSEMSNQITRFSEMPNQIIIFNRCQTKSPDSGMPNQITRFRDAKPIYQIYWMPNQITRFSGCQTKFRR